MFFDKADKESTSETKGKSDRQLLEFIYKKLVALEDRFDDFEEALGGEEGIAEKKELKAEIKQMNAFTQSLCMTLVDNSKAVNLAAATKPSATELYMQRKTAEAEAAKPNGAKPLAPKLPG